MDNRYRPAESPRTGPDNRSAWKTGGGLAGVLAWVAVLSAFYLAEAPNSHNLAGAFLLQGIAIMFFVGSIPAFVVGAAVGALAARRSSRTAAIAIGSYVVLIQVIGAATLVIPALVQQWEREAFIKSMSEARPVRTAFETARMIEIRQKEDAWSYRGASQLFKDGTIPPAAWGRP